MHFKDSSLNESDPYESSIAKAITVTCFFSGGREGYCVAGAGFLAQEFHFEVPPRNCAAGKRQTSAMQKSTPRKKNAAYQACQAVVSEACHIFFEREMCFF